jgi:hypothetical protein
MGEFRTGRVGAATGALLILLALHAPVPLRADYVLGPPEVNDSLKTLGLLRKRADAAQTPRDRADALFDLAQEASSLTSLINLEIRSHGFEQRPLIELAVQRCAAIGVTLTFDSGKDRYEYDRQAYAEYLKLAPPARDERQRVARFVVIEKTFYKQKSSDRPGIETLIRDIEQFLARFPDEERKSELELFLAVLYRDLFTLKASEPDGGIAERKRTEEICKTLVANYPASPEARVAEGILKRLSAGSPPR